MSTPSEAIAVQGHCYCGEIQFQVRIPAGERPIFTAYCHCDSCRRAHAAPLYQVVCVDASMFELTAGQDKLTEFHKHEGKVGRAFCGHCGTRILNRFPNWRPEGREPLVFFPNLLEADQLKELPDALRPGKHFHKDECVLDETMLQQLFEQA